MASSTARHDRETIAKAARVSGASRENTRRAGIIRRAFVDGTEALLSGDYSVNELYRLARGDNRVGINILVSPALRDAINNAAAAAGMTRQDYLAALLTQIFGEVA